MNGHTPSGIEAYGQSDYDDDDDVQPTGIDCPYCGHEIVWSGYLLVCDMCSLTWDSAEHVEHDRKVEQGR